MSKKIVLFGLFMFFASLSFAQNREPGMEKEQRMGPPPIMEKLNLSDEQKTEFKKINLKTEENVVSIRCEIENAQIELKKELSESPKLENLLSINDKLSQMDKKVKEEHIKNWYEVYKILNEDQKKIWIESFRMMNDRPDAPKRMMRQ